MTKRLDTIVIGGGQSGLAISYYLTQKEIEHIILEKNRMGESWKSKRWDSFTLVTPNWQLQLPGFPYKGDNPDGYLTRDEVTEYLDNYAAMFNPPLRQGVEAKSIKENEIEDGFIVETNTGELEASNVVIAAGTFQKPKIPQYSNRISPDVIQLHSSLYRNPRKLPPGAVLVVGSGQSGCQIAEELYQSGRKVFLSTGSAGRAPRKYRGKDFTWWLGQMGIIDRTVDDLTSPKERFQANPQVSGKDGGRTLNLHNFAKDGVTLLGRLNNAMDYKLIFDDNLKENLSKADKFASELKKGVDKFIEKSGIEAPEEDNIELSDGFKSDIITELDLKSENISIIIWAIGYKFDFSWVKFPVFDEFGYPIQKRGITKQPGLYFLGLHWLHTIKSGLFAGVGDDAAHIAEHINDRLGVKN